MQHIKSGGTAEANSFCPYKGDIGLFFCYPESSASQHPQALPGELAHRAVFADVGTWGDSPKRGRRPTSRACAAEPPTRLTPPKLRTAQPVPPSPTSVFPHPLTPLTPQLSQPFFSTPQEAQTMIIPSCDDIMELSNTYNIIPLCKEIYADIVTPITLRAASPPSAPATISLKV